MPCDALSSESFAGLMRSFPIPQGEKVAIAVSGGPDSMCLAFCLSRFLGASRVQAFIVEHGLREESAREAESVAASLRKMGISAEILPWKHEVISSRIHVRARQARYALLLDACRKNGIKMLFLAHHADDQAETILMRFAKGSGIDGLAGMSPANEMEGVLLARPFLSLPKAVLVEACSFYHVPFVVDPSNTKEKYARGRLRRVMPMLAEEGMSVERLNDLAVRAREAKDALDFYTLGFLRKSAQCLEGGAYRLDLTEYRGLPKAVALRALGFLFTHINPVGYLPERKHLLPFWAWLVDQDERDARTLHGCLVQKGDMCDRATFQREPASIVEKLPISGGETRLWDGRWLVSYHGHETGLHVRALGFQSHDEIEELSPKLRDKIPQGRVRACLPSLWRENTLVAVPSFPLSEQDVVRARVVLPPWK